MNMSHPFNAGTSMKQISSRGLLGLFLELEDGGDMLL
jgi:hypothetical protein